MREEQLEHRVALVEDEMAEQGLELILRRAEGKSSKGMAGVGQPEHEAALVKERGDGQIVDPGDEKRPSIRDEAGALEEKGCWVG